MDIFLQVLYTILVLGALILIHEFGHFIAARLSGVKVNEFAIGMGPTLVKIKGKETKYSIRLFPIGGFVAMKGEDDGEEGEGDDSFRQKPIWKRMIIIVSGALMNFLLGFIITAIIVFQAEALPSTTVSDFLENPLSAQTGLMANDTIKKIGNKNIIVYTDIITAFSAAYNQNTFDITVIRDGEEIILRNVEFPLEKIADDLYSATVDFRVFRDEKNIQNTLKHAIFRTRSFVTLLYGSIADMATGRLSVKYVSGPVGMSSSISEAAKSDGTTFFTLVSLISINLAIVNLLPLPALDGGRFIFLLIELIFRKPIPTKFEAAINMAGMMCLLILMAVIVFKDILFPII